MALLFLALALLLQTPAAPPRDVHVPSEPRPGKGVLRGRVLDAQSGQPIRGATVTAYWQAQHEPPSTVTDVDGRWEIAGLMPGEYHIGASKGGYVDRIDFDTGIGLTDTQHERSVDLRLARGAILSGRIIDADGEPEVGVQVMVLAPGPGRRGPRGWNMASGGAATDDRGLFRIFGLAAGEYILAATRQDRAPARSNSRDGSNLTYVMTYYPGTTELAEAQRFSLAEGAEYSDLTFGLQTLTSVSVSGRVVVSTDRIRHGYGAMQLKEGLQEFEHSGGVMVQHDGAFRIPRVPAGTYRLNMMVELTNGEKEVGQLEIVVADEDISGVVLSTSGATTITGRVVVEPAGARRPEMITLHAMPVVDRMQMGGGEDAVVRPDGTFELKAFDSPVRFHPSGPLEGWVRAGVRWKGDDVSRGLSFEPGQKVEGVEVVLRRATSRLTGSVAGASPESESEKEGMVIAFRDGGDDPAGLGVAAMVPIRNGRYALGPLPASEYQLVAVRSSDPKFFQRLELVELLRARATTVSVGDNETKTVNLTLITDH